MALRVPTVTGPAVQEQGAPTVYQRSSATPELLGGPARQLGQAGSALSDVGQELTKQANALRVDDAVNEATEIALRLQHDKKDGFTNQTGYAALARGSGKPLADEYTGRLKEEIDRITQGLGNDVQRRTFSARANNLAASFYGAALSHEGKQQREYNMSVREATVTNAKNALVLNPDPQNIDAQVTRIRSAIEGGRDESGTWIPGSAELGGKSAAWAKETADQHVSEAHTGAIKSALESGNVNLAAAYFNRYSKSMQAKDILAVQGVLQKDYDTRQGLTIGNQVFEAVRPRIVPDDFGRLTTLVMGAESGGRRFGADGKLLTSTKGAQGEMQVMPATARDPGYGVKPAKDDSPDELARVGRDYLAAMVRQFKGDVHKALAAYNAGSGAVEEAEAKAGAAKDGSTWLAHLPKETQKYVAGITQQYTAGAGAPAKPTLEELHQQADAALGPNASPLARKTARDQVTARFSDMEKAVKQRAEEATASAMQAVLANGGRFSELPTSVRMNLQQHAPDKVDQVMNFATRVAKGDDSTNPALYLRLSDPAVLRSMSQAQLFTLRTELSEADYKHFANEHSKLTTGQGANGPGDLNSQAVKNTLEQRLRELKIDPTPKDGSSDSMRVGAIRRFVDEQLMAAQRAAGKKFNDAETSAAIDRLFAQSAQLKGWVNNYSAPAVSAKVGDIPKDVREQIKAAFKKQGVSEPTDGQLLNAFLHWNAQQKNGR